MIIQNGLVFEASGHFTKRDLFIDATHTITAAAVPGDTDIIDASGLYVLPGLVDVHIHGAVGYDFCDGSREGLRHIAAYLKANGITSFCPTSMTLEAEELKHIFPSINDIPTNEDFARIIGIHMEGPFLAASRKGAQKEAFIRHPDSSVFHELNAACGNNIRLITIAPEVEGSMEFIQKLHDTVVISCGHSDADYKTADTAFKAGAKHATHLFNAMNPLHHRDPGIIGAAFDHPEVMVEVICDGIHIHPSVIRMIFEIFGEDRVVLISDAMRATGMADGVYELGGQDVYKKGNRATLKDGTLAGSSTNLFDCMKNAISFGIPPEAAIKAATINPAKSIHVSNIGSLAVGNKADILLVDHCFNLKRVL